MPLAVYSLPIRRPAGDCKLRSRSTGSVLVTGVIADPGVGGTEPLCAPEDGVKGVRIVLPPHLWHFGFSPADPGVSPVRLLRRPVRLGW